MATFKERQFWKEFFELYKSKPELWKVKHEDYKNRAKKNAAYEALVKKCREVEPSAGKDFVTKRIASFRTVYKRELKRYKQSLNSGSEETEKYIPSLWYFQLLDFLRDQEETADIESLGVDSGNENNEHKKQMECEPKRKKFKPNSSTDELVRLATQRLKCSQNCCQQIATVWANKLSKMDRNQRIFAEKVINEVIFNGELGLLDYSTTLTNLASIRKRNSVLSIIRNKSINNENDSSQESNLTDYTTNYGHNSNDELSGQESIHSVENYIAEEYDPLDDLVKIED